MILEDFYRGFIDWVDTKLSSKYWLWQVVFLAIAISLFIGFPPYHLLWQHLTPDGGKLDAWVFIQQQAQDLLHPQDIAADVRRENMIYRWTLPLLSFLTGHNVLLMVLLQSLLGVLFLYKAGKYVYETGADKVTAAFFIISLATIFVGSWPFAEIHGYGDGIAYFCLLAAMLSRNPYGRGLWLAAAFFTDERAVIAGGYLLLWWAVQRAVARDDFSWGALFRSFFSGENKVVWVVWAIYMSIRLYVGSHYFPDHTYSTIGTPVLFSSEHRNGLGVGIWTAFEGTWLWILAAGLVLFLYRRYALLLCLAAGFLVLLLTGIFVHDISRALSYGFPFLFIAVFLLIRYTNKRTLQLLLFVTAVFCVIHPQLFYMGFNRILWLEPLPLKIMMLADHLYGWNMFN